MIGLDTSHCGAFVKLLNDATNEHHISGCQVVKAFPGGSKTFSSSYNRVGQYTDDMRQAGLEIVDSIEAMSDMDAFLLESVDGSQHLEQFTILAQFGKPVFIDKPLACGYDDAKKIAQLAADKKIPVMSASAIRFAGGIDDLKAEDEIVGSCDAFGPMALLADYRDYFWYGIHSADVLYSFMGKGCKTVQTISTENFDVIVGKWEDGRIGTMRGNRFGGNNFGCTITTNKEHKTGLASGNIPYYAKMMNKIVPFFQGGASPVDFTESVEVIAYLEAASRSRAANGAEIALASL